MRDFTTDLDLGEKHERELIRELKRRLSNVKHISKVDYRTHPYDLKLTFNCGKSCGIEVKSLAGGYPTGVVEVWADDRMKRRPKWHAEGVDYIFFQDRSRNKWFMYNAQEVIQYLQSYKGNLTRCKNGNSDAPGLIAKFEWSSMPGFITQF